MRLPVGRERALALACWGTPRAKLEYKRTYLNGEKCRRASCTVHDHGSVMVVNPPQA